ncbi:MAG: transcriptional regulator [Campylobacterales bacterium]|nr:transcriptional regulator [Campylobacterales bacterium]
MPSIEKIPNNSKWDRINTIYERLKQSCDGISIQKLSQELNVSTKTIQRDLYEVLGEYGAVKSGRMWKLDKKQSSDGLNPNERIILGILDEMAKNAGRSFYGKAHSLLAQVSQQLEHPIFTNIDSESLEENHISLFAQLEHAIKNKVEITFEYKKHEFYIKPLKLVFFDGFWYLLALDSNHNDKFKKFHLKSISNLTIKENTFPILEDIEDRLKKANSIWFDLDNPSFDVHLYIDKEIVKYFERKPLKGQTIFGEDADGSIELMISITHKMEILPLIFWYLPYIKVLEPQWLADKVKDKVIAYANSL